MFGWLDGGRRNQGGWLSDRLAMLVNWRVLHTINMLKAKLQMKGRMIEFNMWCIVAQTSML